ncbi:MAG: divergent polysaccharide deacetylase family protein [Candidatus Eisenbacteria bacterium]|nr:divergent polysaccharide deacetylase family protein [Candidatus Eisenbacteria bacterium]
MAARNAKRGRLAKKTLLPVVLLVALILSLMTFSFLRTERGERIAHRAAQSVRWGAKRTGPAEFGERLRQIAKAYAARPQDIKVRAAGKLSPEKWTIHIPANQSLLKCNLAVTDEVAASRGKVEDAVERVSREGSQYLEMKLSFGGKVTHIVVFDRSKEIAPVQRASIAIVIDDLGYGEERLADEFLALDYPLTFSVLPGYRKSKSAAEAVLAKGKELILHLPMEPHGYPGINPGKAPILVDLSGGEIRARIAKHLSGLPKVSGISSHMGSLATQDPEVMKAVLEDTKARGMFFLDSMTSPGSVAKKVAAQVGARCLRSDLFLDMQSRDEKKIAKVFERAEGIALSKGKAIVIGHLYGGTLKVLKNKLPELEKKGIKLVPLSSFANEPDPVL